jgi:hypothetical protein
MRSSVGSHRLGDSTSISDCRVVPARLLEFKVSRSALTIHRLLGGFRGGTQCTSRGEGLGP